MAPLSPVARSASPSCADITDTLLFVDVDGVLNVGIRDGARPPLLLDKQSIDSALGLFEARAWHPERDSIERLVSVLRRDVGQGEDVGTTFEQFACTTSRQFSEVLIGRFAEMLRAAGWAPRENSADAGAVGGRATAVLSSTWRAPQHRIRLKGLEEGISKHLGAEFTFDDKTQSKEDHTAEGRLSSIKLYLREFCEKRRLDPESNSRPLRVLVLDDFYNRPLNGITLMGQRLRSPECIEKYLTESLPRTLDVQVKMLHTFMEWTSPSGLSLQVGSGISQDHFLSGVSFIETGVDVGLASDCTLSNPIKIVEEPLPAILCKAQVPAAIDEKGKSVCKILASPWPALSALYAT